MKTPSLSFLLFFKCMTALAGETFDSYIGVRTTAFFKKLINRCLFFSDIFRLMLILDGLLPWLHHRLNIVLTLRVRCIVGQGIEAILVSTYSNKCENPLGQIASIAHKKFMISRYRVRARLNFYRCTNAKTQSEMKAKKQCFCNI